MRAFATLGALLLLLAARASAESPSPPLASGSLRGSDAEAPPRSVPLASPSLAFGSLRGSDAEAPPRSVPLASPSLASGSLRGSDAEAPPRSVPLASPSLAFGSLRGSDAEAPPRSVPLASPSLAFGSLRGSDAEAPPRSVPLAAVATIVPLGWLVAELGGERVAVHTLVPPGASPHAFEPRPSDLGAVAAARLFVSAGAGVDAWVTHLALAEGPRPVVLLDALGDAAPDPHFWLDPILVRDRALPLLEAALVAADPDGRAPYAERRRAFAHALGALDREIESALAGVARRPLVPLHAAWGAFGARYGIPLLPAVQQHAAEEPTPRTLARLAETARAGDAAAVLVEPQLSPAAAAALAETLGVPAVVADPYGDPRDPERASYAALLRFDARAFRTALSGGRD